MQKDRVDSMATEDRLAARLAVGLLMNAFPPDLIDEVLSYAGAHEQRTRALPARLAVYSTLALWLFPGSEYTVAGHGEPEPFTLATTLLDPGRAPAIELARLYPDLWRLHTMISVFETGRHAGPGVVFRSRSPEGVVQELWAMLCVHQAIRHLAPL
jgi:hypothetical protein